MNAELIGAFKPVPLGTLKKILPAREINSGQNKLTLRLYDKGITLHYELKDGAKWISLAKVIVKNTFLENKANEILNGLADRGLDVNIRPDEFLSIVRQFDPAMKDVVKESRLDMAALSRMPHPIENANPTRGGIDLNTSNGMRWKVRKEGNGVEMDVDPAMVARIRHEGIDWLAPRVLRMTPVASIWSLVGLQAPVQ